MSDSAAAGSESTGALSTSEIHDVLRNDRRRLVLERLRATDGDETVSDLAEHIGAIEADESPPPRNVRQSVYVSLHQTHLPKLDDLGIVTYDPDGKTVALAANADDLDAYLHVGSDDDRVPATYYLGLGLVGTAATLAAAAGVPGLRAVGPAAVGTGVSALVVAIALYDRRQETEGEASSTDG